MAQVRAIYIKLDKETRAIIERWLRKRQGMQLFQTMWPNIRQHGDLVNNPVTARTYLVRCFLALSELFSIKMPPVLVLD